jgi:NAD(P)-dependent dehydrogenase (short-subunit alcohol dehydrogenase family)
MRNLKGRFAVVTGAASGIGLGIARALAKAGAHVALADIRAEAVETARREIEALGVRAIGLALDVSDRAAVYRAARQVDAAFGKLHILCNNAGVAFSGTPLDTVEDRDWDWVIGVNLYGPINGLQAFLPLIKRHGEGGHVVNTASIAGFQIRPGFRSGVYGTTKYAVVALSEALAMDLAPHGIGVSVLAPQAVNTDIYRSARVRPARFGGAFAKPEGEFMSALLKAGLDPDAVGERVLRAIRHNEFYVFTHPETRAWLAARHRRMMAAFDLAERLAEPSKQRRARRKPRRR